MRKTPSENMIWRNICTSQQRRLSSVAKRSISCVHTSAQATLGSVILWAPDNRDLTMGPLLMKRRGWQRMGWFGRITDAMDMCLCAKLQRVRHDWRDCRPQALSTAFSRQEPWSGFPFPSPRDLPGPNLHFMSPALASRFFTASITWEAPNEYELSKFQVIGKDREVWCAVVHGTAESDTIYQLNKKKKHQTSYSWEKSLLTKIMFIDFSRSIFCSHFDFSFCRVLSRDIISQLPTVCLKHPASGTYPIHQSTQVLWEIVIITSRRNNVLCSPNHFSFLLSLQKDDISYFLFLIGGWGLAGRDT